MSILQNLQERHTSYYPNSCIQHSNHINNFICKRSFIKDTNTTPFI